jgi:hypothetical protein
MARAGSCSRGRRVSFKFDKGSDRVEEPESPSNRERERNSDRKSYSTRAQTPGPDNGLPKVAIKKRGHDSKRKLKGGGDLG